LDKPERVPVNMKIIKLVVDGLDEVVKRKGYPSRTAAAHEAFIDFIEKNKEEA
jgi:metal-responsive CopG/Arc/MetJ family transcriptional regulator